MSRVERLDAPTHTPRTLPAFKILPLFALAATLGCHGANSQEHASAKPDSTAMPDSTAVKALIAATPTPNATATDGTADCPEHGGACAAHAQRAAETPPLPAGPGAANVGKYGAALGTAPSESLAAVLSEPARYAGRPLRVEGHVRRACTAMGCWMELAQSGADDAPACRVIMKDHAFFVPKDSAGSNARVEGTLAVRRIEPAQVAHMESEGAEFPRKAPDGSAEELRFVASGVELWRGS